MPKGEIIKRFKEQSKNYKMSQDTINQLNAKIAILEYENKKVDNFNANDGWKQDNNSEGLIRNEFSGKNFDKTDKIQKNPYAKLVEAGKTIDQLRYSLNFQESQNRSQKQRIEELEHIVQWKEIEILVRAKMYQEKTIEQNRKIYLTSKKDDHLLLGFLTN